MRKGQKQRAAMCAIPSECTVFFSTLPDAETGRWSVWLCGGRSGIVRDRAALGASIGSGAKIVAAHSAYARDRLPSAMGQICPNSPPRWQQCKQQRCFP
jgi:hypothetical protein